jgi:PAS domain S-box-containing protein
MIARMKKKLTDSIKKVQTIGETVKTLQNNESGKSYEYVSKFLELLIRSLPGIFYALDDNFKLLIWNENAENISGYTAEEAEHLGLVDIFGGNDRIIIENAVREAFHTGEGAAQATFITKKGKQIPYYFTGASAVIEGKSYLLGIGIDLSRFKEAQESLIESEALYRTFAERMTEGVALISNGKIVFANNNFASIIGFPNAAEIIGQDIMDFVSKDFEMYFREVFDFIEKGMSKERFFQARWLKNKNQQIWVEGKGNIFQWKGNPTVLLTARDITESKLKEISMQEETAYLRRENVTLRSSIKDRYRFGDIIGKSVAIQEIYERSLNAAATNANVIIYGESGTGKELVAKAIHRLSNRSQNNFVPVNCAAIPENLIESEFFGYKKGAFTGANGDKQGYLDKANGGTLFLDEVGELGLNIQAKLLRAIEGGGYSPVGSNIVKHSDFRIIAATNKNLIEYTNKGLMREDFFYRIHIIPIQLPPLRQRKEDIPLLVEHFIRLNSPGKKVVSVPGKVLEALQKYDWPGNVRELHNVIQRYLMVNKIEILTPLRHQPSEMKSEIKSDEQASFSDTRNDPEFHEEAEKTDKSPLMGNLSEYTEKSEKAAILKALNQNRWNKGKTAEILNISRKTLHRKMQRFGLL